MSTAPRLLIIILEKFNSLRIIFNGSCLTSYQILCIALIWPFVSVVPERNWYMKLAIYWLNFVMNYVIILSSVANTTTMDPNCYACYCCHFTKSKRLSNVKFWRYFCMVFKLFSLFSEHKWFNNISLQCDILVFQCLYIVYTIKYFYINGLLFLL